MTRFWVPLVLLGVLSGCTSSGAGNRPTDPFFGRTRIEPPTTGWAQGQRSPDPYYSNTRSSSGRSATGASGIATPTGTIGPPSVTLPTGTNPQSLPNTQPPGNWQAPSGVQTLPPAATGSAPPAINLSVPSGSSRGTGLLPGGASNRAGDRIEIPVAARDMAGSPLTVASRSENRSWLGNTPEADKSPTNAAAAAPSAAASAASLATPNPRYGNNAASTDLSTRERITRVLEPRPASATNRNSWSTTGTASPAAVTRQAVDIMDLPPAGTSGAYRGSQTSDSTGQVRLTSATEPVTDSPTQNSRTATGAAASAAAASTGKRLGE